MSLPLLSIGMPVYNGEAFLRSALDSLLGQTFRDFELILSDDASTDGTKAICSEYAARDQRIRYVRQPANIGMLANYRLVLSEARAGLFMWASQDDVWGQRYIELSIAALKSEPTLAGAMVAPYDRPSYRSIIQGYLGFEEATPNERVSSYLRSLPSGNVVMYAVWRRNGLDGIFPAREFVAFDWTMTLRALQGGPVRVAYDAENGLFKRPGGASHKPLRLDLRTLRREANVFRIRHFIRSVPPQYRRECRNILFRLYVRDAATTALNVSKLSFRTIRSFGRGRATP